MKIMVVDDHTRMRAMFCELLKGPDNELKECAGGAEALEAYAGFQPDWVIMDSAMKGLDGLSATRAIIGDFPEARVLVVGEDGIEQLRRAARKAGACGFVTKEHLLRALRQNPGLPLGRLEGLWTTPTQTRIQ